MPEPSHRSWTRFWPYAVGLLLAVPLSMVGQHLEDLGSWGYVLSFVVFVAVAVGAVTLGMAAAMPKDAAFVPTTEGAVPTGVRALVDQFTALGFRRIGPPFRGGIEGEVPARPALSRG